MMNGSKGALQARIVAIFLAELALDLLASTCAEISSLAPQRTLARCC